MRRIIALCVISLGLVGCQSLPPVNFAVPNVGYSEKKVDADLRAVSVSLAGPEEKTGDLPAGAEVAAPLWKAALEDAINRMALFKDDAEKRVNLSVKILAIDMPVFGASMTTTSAARYEIIDRENGDIIFTQDITTEGVVPFDYAFVGMVRARESLNRSVQNNIAEFLQALETIDVTKPMFPAGVAQK